MNATITYTSLNSLVPWPALLEQQLSHWHSLTTITSAEVVLDQQRDARKAFRVKVRLELAGPEMRAEASDITLEGALLMATRDLEHQIQARNTKSLGQASNARQPDRLAVRRINHKE